MVTCQILKDFLQMELPISIKEATDKTSPSFHKLQWKNLPILVSLWSRIQKSIPICTKDLSIEGAVVPGLLLCSRTKQKPRNNSALYWKVFSQRPQIYRYRKVASSNMSHWEAHAGFFWLLMKGIFDPYVMWPFDWKLIS